MSDKTRLELDLEHRERYKTPFIVKLMIFLIVLGLFLVSFYNLELKKELSEKEHEIVLLKERFMKEKTDLIRKINKLKEEKEISGSE